MSLLRLIFIIFGKHCQIVLCKNGVNLSCTVSIRCQCVKTLWYIHTRSVCTMGSAGLYMCTSRLCMCKQSNIHANHVCNIINQWQQFIKLLWCNGLIFCSRIRYNLCFVHLLIYSLHMLCLIALWSQTRCQFSQIH